MLLDTETSWVMSLEPFNSTVSVHSKIWLEHISSLPSGLAVKKQEPVTTCIAAACCVLLIHKHSCKIVRRYLKLLKTTLAKLTGRYIPGKRTYDIFADH